MFGAFECVLNSKNSTNLQKFQNSGQTNKHLKGIYNMNTIMVPYRLQLMPERTFKTNQKNTWK